MDKKFLKSAFLYAFLVTLDGVIHAGGVRCMDQDLASIHGLIPGIKDGANLPSNHLSVESISGVDDGGDYKGLKYTYENFEVTTVRGYIDSIRITSPHISWAGGISIGIERDRIDNSLEYARVFEDKTSSQYLVCSTAGDVYAILEFSENLLKSIEIVIDRP